MLEGGGWFTLRPSRLIPGKARYPVHTRLSVPWDRSRRVRNILLHRDSTSGPSSPQRVATPLISYRTGSMSLQAIFNSKHPPKFLKSSSIILLASIHLVAFCHALPMRTHIDQFSYTGPSREPKHASTSNNKKLRQNVSSSL